MPAEKTPTGAKMNETPTYDLSKAVPFGSYGTFSYSHFLGDPERRIGRLVSSRSVPMGSKLEMLTDPRIVLSHARISAPLISAPYQITCADPVKKAFFEAMWMPLHHKFMLSAVMSVALGALGFIKMWEFAEPGQTEEQRMENIDPWPYDATPYIITGLEAMHPQAVEPTFDEDGFAGMRFTMTSENGKPIIVPPHFCLWMTRGLAEAFGDYAGMGRLVYCYRPWWENSFSRDLRMVHIQRLADPPVKASFPPGTSTDTDDPTSAAFTNRDRALIVGNAVRAGSTIAVPSDPYLNADGNYTSRQRWDIEVMSGLSNLAEFDRIFAQDSEMIFMGYLLPPQSVLNAQTGGMVGTGKSTTEILDEIVVQMSVIEWRNITAHINEYVFAKVDELNFVPGSPPATLEGTGEGGEPQFDKSEMDQLRTLVHALVQKGEGDFDLDAAMQRLNYPVVEREAEVEAAPIEERPKTLASMSRSQQARLSVAPENVTVEIEEQFKRNYDEWVGMVGYQMEHSPGEDDRSFELAALLAMLALWMRDHMRAEAQRLWESYAGPFTASALLEFERQLAFHYDYISNSLLPDLRIVVAQILLGNAQSWINPTTGGFAGSPLQQALSAKRSRVGMYAAALWGIIEAARAWALTDIDPLCKWVGPIDDRMCRGCREQMIAGERQLSRTPRIGTQQCITNCRHHIEYQGIDY